MRAARAKCFRCSRDIARHIQIGQHLLRDARGTVVLRYRTGDLIDGGSVGMPDLGFYNLEGQWDVENHGVSPDYEVEMNPKLVREGHDPQLEKAVEVALDQLNKHPVNYGKRPAYPDYHNGKKTQP